MDVPKTMLFAIQINSQMIPLPWPAMVSEEQMHPNVSLMNNSHQFKYNVKF